MKKILTFRGQIINPQSPKTEFVLKNQYGRVICPSIRGKNVKITPHNPKTEFGLQNQYGRVTYPSIGNLIYNKKKFTFGGQKS
jgi:hypothetical protein